ncbi:HNH/endonuclease VII fold putative polymorphic toxin [Enterobacter asburiae]
MIYYSEQLFRHVYGPPGTPGNQGPHINIRPGSDSRNGTIPGMLEYYPF